jgi:hypothetical protein
VSRGTTVTYKNPPHLRKVWDPNAPAPRYSMRRPRRLRYNKKLHIEDVKCIRRWAGREGYGLSIAEQARRQHVRYPGLSLHALGEILSNKSWYDANYDRDRPDSEWAELPVAAILLQMMQQMNASVSSPIKVDGLQETGLPQRGERVLHGAAVEAGVIGQGLGGAGVLAPQRGEHATGA